MVMFVVIIVLSVLIGLVWLLYMGLLVRSTLKVSTGKQGEKDGHS